MIEHDIAKDRNLSEPLRTGLSKYSIPEELAQYLHDYMAGKTDEVSCVRDKSVKRRRGSKIHDVGLFAKENIAEATVVAIKPGRKRGKLEVAEKKDVLGGSYQQISDAEFIVGDTPEEIDRNLIGFNHSCDPNSKIVIVKGFPIAFLVTKKDIEVGDELTVDYGVSQMSDLHRICPCKCGSENCRHVVLPKWDWLNPEFQKENRDDFPWFIDESIRKLDKLAREGSREQVEAEIRIGDMLYDANIVIMCSEIFNELKGEREKVIRGVPFYLRRFFIKRMDKTGDLLREYERVLMESANNFAKTCMFANLEEYGVDRNDPNSVEKHLSDIISFACQINEIFN